MSRNRGTPSYSSYRGRTPRWKTALAVALVLVCLLSGSVLFMQRFLVYDEKGHARLEMPWADESLAAENEDVVPELHIEEPEKGRVTADQKAFLMDAVPLTMEAWNRDLGYAAANGLNTAAVTLRQGGKVYFDSVTASHGAVAAKADTSEALKAFTGAYEHAVARVGCLLDGVAAQSNVEELGLKNTGGYIFYDGNNHNWLDPAKPRTVEYLSGIVTECAELGFDEILLTEFSFPTVGKLNKIQYPDQGRSESLNGLLTAMRQALDQSGHQDVALSLELTAEAVLAGRDDVAGIDVGTLCETADAVYVPCDEQDIPALERALGDTAQLVPELSAKPVGNVDCYLILPQR